MKRHKSSIKKSEHDVKSWKVSKSRYLDQGELLLFPLSNPKGPLIKMLETDLCETGVIVVEYRRSAMFIYRLYL